MERRERAWTRQFGDGVPEIGEKMPNPKSENKASWERAAGQGAVLAEWQETMFSSFRGCEL